MENHNVLRHDGGENSKIVLESARGTTWCPTRVFDFFIACTEVNAYLALKHFLKTDGTSMKFWGEMSKALFSTHISMKNHKAVK